MDRGALDQVYLNNNRLLALPPKLGRCQRLEILNVARNNIARVPVSVGRLTALRSLDLSENPLTHLPHEIGGVDAEEFADVCGLLSIQRISLMHCAFLVALPSKLFRLTTLEELTLIGADGLTQPPMEVQAGGLEHIQLYLRRQYEGEQSMKVDFSGLGLVDVPLMFSNLDRRLNEIQPAIAGMDKLLHLNLSHNFLERLNRNMRFLTNLRSLRVEYNRLQELPVFIQHFTRLGLLAFSHNPLDNLVNEMRQMKLIRTIVGSYNRLSFINDAVGFLETLTDITLEHNQITSIPEPVLKLSGLVVLRLGSNQIKRVPEQITAMRSLKQLHLADNLLVTVPEVLGDMEALQDLDLADNRIEFLPVGLGRLTTLTKLEVRRNGCIRPPKGTQVKGPAAIVEYLRRVDSALQCRCLPCLLPTPASWRQRRAIGPLRTRH